MLIAVSVFVLNLAIILGGYWVLIVRPETREERTLRRRLRTGPKAAVLGTAVVKVRQKLSALKALDSALSGSVTASEPLRRVVEESHLPLTVGAVLLASVFVALLTMALVTLVTASGWLGLGVGAAAASLPILYVRRAARKRLATLEEQFPEATDLIARALRAGHALPTALQMVGDEIPDPLGAEFRLLFEQQNFGMALPDALKAFAVRVPIMDARFFITAVLTQRETGGNLAELLNKLAAVIRERFKVRRQVRVISAHARISGWVLGSLAPVVALILFFIAPAQMRPLIDDPLGARMIVVAVVLQVVGVLLIKRIVNVEY